MRAGSFCWLGCWGLVGDPDPDAGAVWLGASGRLGKMGCPASLLFSAGLESSSGLRLLNKETPLRIWKRTLSV
ncbi:hypothetical protein HKD30_04700 [Gluconobacter sphaericus]|nr:hypothetical protein [Gluconobacter sphaericus]